MSELKRSEDHLALDNPWVNRSSDLLCDYWQGRFLQLARSRRESIPIDSRQLFKEVIHVHQLIGFAVLRSFRLADRSFSVARHNEGRAAADPA